MRGSAQDLHATDRDAEYSRGEGRRDEPRARQSERGMSRDDDRRARPSGAPDRGEDRHRNGATRDGRSRGSFRPGREEDRHRSSREPERHRDHRERDRDRDRDRDGCACMHRPPVTPATAGSFRIALACPTAGLLFKAGSGWIWLKAVSRNMHLPRSNHQALWCPCRREHRGASSHRHRKSPSRRSRQPRSSEEDRAGREERQKRQRVSGFDGGAAGAANGVGAGPQLTPAQIGAVAVQPRSRCPALSWPPAMACSACMEVVKCHGHGWSCACAGWRPPCVHLKWCRVSFPELSLHHTVHVVMAMLGWHGHVGMGIQECLQLCGSLSRDPLCCSDEHDGRERCPNSRPAHKRGAEKEAAVGQKGGGSRGACSGTCCRRGRRAGGLWRQPLGHRRVLPGGGQGEVHQAHGLQLFSCLTGGTRTCNLSHRPGQEGMAEDT